MFRTEDEILSKYIHENLPKKVSVSPVLVKTILDTLYKGASSADADWKRKLINLTTLLSEQNLQPTVHKAIVDALIRFVNSRNCDLDGRYERRYLFAKQIYWITETDAFKRFNLQLQELTHSLSNELPEEEKAELTLAIGLNKVFTFVKDSLRAAVDSKSLPYAILIFSQIVLAEAVRETGIIIPTNGTGQLTDDLVAYYPFNGSAINAAGNASNDGIVYGAMGWLDRFGNERSSYYFDGISYIEGWGEGFPIGDQARSISLWYKPVVYYFAPGIDRRLVSSLTIRLSHQRILQAIHMAQHFMFQHHC